VIFVCTEKPLAKWKNKMPAKTSDKYQWTKHSLYKMRHYGLSAQRVKRIIRHPERTEEAIVPDMIAVMCPDKNREIWAMYTLVNKHIKIITAWRYPGKSSARNPIPQKILDEVRNVIY